MKMIEVQHEGVKGTAKVPETALKLMTGWEPVKGPDDDESTEPNGDPSDQSGDSTPDGADDQGADDAPADDGSPSKATAAKKATAKKAAASPDAGDSKEQS